MYYWQIKRDHLKDEIFNREGTRSDPTSVPFEDFIVREDVKELKWRTLDDDGNKCHEGSLWVTDKSNGTERAMFAPLDEFSQPDVGATEIQYLNYNNSKGWETI